MSIDRTQSISAVSTVQSRDANDNSARVRQAAVKTEKVQSDAQVQLSDAQAQLMRPDSKDINMERVEQIKTAIRNGELKMDSGKIADALIAETEAYLKGD